MIKSFVESFISGLFGLIRMSTKTGRNELCPCGSGKKYKKYCMNKEKTGHYFHLKGVQAEDFIHDLAKKSFFDDWCYPRPCLNGKEICDLLVVYGDIAIIWQVKDLKLRQGKYKKSEVDKNIRQLLGAKKTLLNLKSPIELENPRRGKEVINSSQIKEVYLISGLLGEAEDYFSFVELTKGGIIHVFNRDFAELILNELDTTSDFIHYLREKENLLADNERIVLMGGEEELLAYYLANGHSFKELQKADSILMEHGSWEALQKRPEYVAKNKANEISYLWDSILNRAHTSGKGYEIIARELARTNRFERRVLSKSFYETQVKAHNEQKVDNARRVVELNGTTYAFVFMDDTEPREKRKALLSAVCFISRGIHKANRKVVGIATEMKIRRQCSYDFCFLEKTDWTDENQKEMEYLQEKTGILTRLDWKKSHDDEYPATNS